MNDEEALSFMKDTLNQDSILVRDRTGEKDYRYNVRREVLYECSGTVTYSRRPEDLLPGEERLYSVEVTCLDRVRHFVCQETRETELP
jgi:hypothetical protein